MRVSGGRVGGGRASYDGLQDLVSNSMHKNVKPQVPEDAP